MRILRTPPLLAQCLILCLTLCACGENKASPTQVDAATSGSDAAPGLDSQAEDAAGDDGVASDVAEADVVAGVLPPKKQDGALTVLTYNVMCSFCINKEHPEYVSDWNARVPWLRDVMTRADADLIGLQELQAVLKQESGVSEMAQLFPEGSGYDYAFYKLKPEDSYLDDYPDPLVAWKKARFDKLQEGWFWLSPTPDVSFSTGFAKTQFPRLVYWVKLHDKLKNRDLYLASTHFDNNYPSQKLSAPLSHEEMSPLAADAPLIFTGDFNSGPDSEAYALLVGPNEFGTQWLDAEVIAKSKSIVHNQPVEPSWDGLEQIDHVFLAGDVTFAVDWWGIDLWRYGELAQPPSDHNGAYITYIDWP